MKRDCFLEQSLYLNNTLPQKKLFRFKIIISKMFFIICIKVLSE